MHLVHSTWMLSSTSHKKKKKIYPGFIELSSNLLKQTIPALFSKVKKKRLLAIWVNSLQLLTCFLFLTTTGNKIEQIKELKRFTWAFVISSGK